MKNIFAIFFLFICSAPQLIAQDNDLNSLFEHIYDEDQFAREKLIFFQQNINVDSLLYYAEQVTIVDSINQIKTFDILDNKGWPKGLSEKANVAIFLVIDHSDLKNQKKYVDLLKQQTDNGVIEKEYYIILCDRILLYEGKKQIYGTQMLAKSLDNKQVSYIWPVEDPENIDSLRLSVGLPPFNIYIKDAKDQMGINVIWDKNLTIKELNALPNIVIID